MATIVVSNIEHCCMDDSNTSQPNQLCGAKLITAMNVCDVDLRYRHVFFNCFILISVEVRLLIVWTAFIESVRMLYCLLSTFCRLADVFFCGAIRIYCCFKNNRHV